MRIHLATDHAGFEHKQVLKGWLDVNGYTVVDHGAQHYDEHDDFPDFIASAAQAVHNAPQTDKAIIFGGSGQGEAMLANQWTQVRATVFYGGDRSILTLSREHNDANVLSIGSRFVPQEDVIAIVEQWLQTEFSAAERHVRRLKKMSTYPD